MQYARSNHYVYGRQTKSSGFHKGIIRIWHCCRVSGDIALECTCFSGNEALPSYYQHMYKMVEYLHSYDIQ